MFSQATSPRASLERYRGESGFSYPQLPFDAVTRTAKHLGSKTLRNPIFGVQLALLMQSSHLPEIEDSGK